MKFLITFLVFLPFACCSQQPAACSFTQPINTQIVKIAESKLGKKVDRGECWDLAKLVLDESNADWDGFYAFGKELDLTTDCIQPGDIIQFENVKTHLNVENGYYEESFSHHTAIIHKVLGPGKVELIQQNFGEAGRKVGTSILDFSNITKGKITIYRPLPKA